MKNRKKESRSKLHIQSNDQRKNLEFMMENLASLLCEVCAMNPNFMQVMKATFMEKAQCPQCGKHFINKKGVKQHTMRINSENKDK